MGCIMLWKGANMSLTPEDVGMIVHQTSVDTGSVPGKENRWGAGKIDALAGLERALCVQRVDGEPAWEVAHKAGTPVTFELDGSPNRYGFLLFGPARGLTDFGFVRVGLAAPVLVFAMGNTKAAGEFELQFPVPASAVGASGFSQFVLDDTAGPTGKWLTSNVVGLRVVQ